ncbi:MAG: hypothetical protein LBN10_06950 [Propionibacteriaceae bacterium]|jgi:hypothetical protein|nr:hypothetical protein [Propionibacteriaceae bacterium]
MYAHDFVFSGRAPVTGWIDAGNYTALTSEQLNELELDNTAERPGNTPTVAACLWEGYGLVCVSDDYPEGFTLRNEDFTDSDGAGYTLIKPPGVETDTRGIPETFTVEEAKNFLSSYAIWNYSDNLPGPWPEESASDEVTEESTSVAEQAQTSVFAPAGQVPSGWVEECVAHLHYAYPMSWKPTGTTGGHVTDWRLYGDANLDMGLVSVFPSMPTADVAKHVDEFTVVGAGGWDDILPVERKTWKNANGVRGTLVEDTAQYEGYPSGVMWGIAEPEVGKGGAIFKFDVAMGEASKGRAYAQFQQLLDSVWYSPTSCGTLSDPISVKQAEQLVLNDLPEILPIERASIPSSWDQLDEWYGASISLVEQGESSTKSNIGEVVYCLEYSVTRMGTGRVVVDGDGETVHDFELSSFSKRTDPFYIRCLS